MPRFNSNVLAKSIVLVLCAAMPLVGGCGEEPKSPGGSDDVHDTPTDGATSMSYLPYSIRFKLDGTPVIVDEKGEVVEVAEAKLPLKATSLVGVQTVTVVTYTGSCKQAFNIGGKVYEITLPDGYCKSL